MNDLHKILIKHLKKELNISDEDIVSRSLYLMLTAIEAHKRNIQLGLIKNEVPILLIDFLSPVEVECPSEPLG